MDITLAGQINGVNALKDKTVKVVLHLQETDASDNGKIFSMMNEFVKIYLTTENITSEARQAISNFEFEVEEKSPSKRMRNVLFRRWEQDNAGYEDFELYYRYRMNQIIEHIKDKLQ